MASCTITFAGSSPACPQSLSTAGLQGGPRGVVQVLSLLGLLATLPCVTVYRNRVRLAWAVSLTAAGIVLEWEGKGFKAQDLPYQYPGDSGGAVWLLATGTFAPPTPSSATEESSGFYIITMQWEFWLEKAKCTGQTQITSKSSPRSSDSRARLCWGSRRVNKCTIKGCFWGEFERRPKACIDPCRRQGSYFSDMILSKKTWAFLSLLHPFYASILSSFKSLLTYLLPREVFPNHPAKNPPPPPAQGDDGPALFLFPAHCVPGRSVVYLFPRFSLLPFTGL